VILAWCRDRPGDHPHPHPTRASCSSSRFTFAPADPPTSIGPHVLVDRHLPLVQRGVSNNASPEKLVLDGLWERGARRPATSGSLRTGAQVERCRRRSKIRPTLTNACPLGPMPSASLWRKEPSRSGGSSLATVTDSGRRPTVFPDEEARRFRVAPGRLDLDDDHAQIYQLWAPAVLRPSALQQKRMLWPCLAL
jgi:hypothetical protein